MAGHHITTRLMDGLMNIIVVVAGALYLNKIALPPAVFKLPALCQHAAGIHSPSGRVYRAVSAGMTGIERFQGSWTLLLEIKDVKDAKPLQHVKGEIRFEDVSFPLQGRRGGMKY